MFEFRFYSSRYESLNYYQPGLDENQKYVGLFNYNDNRITTCNLIKPQEFDTQYAYYLMEEGDNCVFNIILTQDLNVNVSTYGSIGIFLRKLLVLHYPNRYDVVRIYLPNCVTPITKLCKAQFRIACTNDLLLALKDDYNRIEVI